MSNAVQREDKDGPTPQVQLWARAHREAARAVVATLLGARVLNVELSSGPPVTGRTQVTGLETPDTSAPDYGLVRRIVYQLAGPIAEHIATAGSGAILNEPASLMAAALAAGVRDPSSIDPDTDVGIVAGLILDHFGPDNEAAAAAAVDHLALSVETCVRSQWDAVNIVALRLLRRGRLTEEDLQSLWSDVLPAPRMPDGLLPPSVSPDRSA